MTTNGSDCPTPPSTKASSAARVWILDRNALGSKSEGVAEGPQRAFIGTPGMGVNLWGASPLYEDESLKEGGQRL